MNNAKRQAMIETAYDLVQKVHHDLCVSRKTKEAEQTLDIQRRLMILSQMLEKEK